MNNLFWDFEFLKVRVKIVKKPEEGMENEKRVNDSITEQTYLLMSMHINGYGRLFGGILMQWIDELAGIVARRHCGYEVT